MTQLQVSLIRAVSASNLGGRGVIRMADATLRQLLFEGSVLRGPSGEVPRDVQVFGYKAEVDNLKLHGEMEIVPFDS